MVLKSWVRALLAASAFPVLAAAACQDRSIATTTAPIGDVISAVKCELALYELGQKEQAGRLDLRAAAIVLTLKAVNIDSGGANVAGVIPVGTAVISPSFSANRSRTTSQTVKISLDVEQAEIRDASVCDKKKREEGQVEPKLEIKDGLTSINGEFKRAADGQPRVALKDFVLTFNLGVVQKDTAGIKFDLVVLTIGATAESSREDVQTLEITVVEDVARDPTKPDPNRDRYWRSIQKLDLLRKPL